MKRLLWLVIFLLFTFYCMDVHAGEPKPGRIIKVTCKKIPTQQYQCYLPLAYDASKEWPILYCFAPGGGGETIVKRYKKYCDRQGWIVVASVNSRNGLETEEYEKIKSALWEDCEERFNLCTSMRFASGFSGSARISFWLAEDHSEIAGVIAIAAGTHRSVRNAGEYTDETLPRKEMLVYLTCGDKDFNHEELQGLNSALKKRGNEVKLEVFKGGHEVPSDMILEDAILWMDKRAREKKEKKFDDAILKSQQLLEEGKAVEGYVILSESIELNRNSKEHLHSAESLMTKFMQEKDLKSEKRARKMYDKALEWDRKNKNRMEKSEKTREFAIAKYRKVIEKYPDTPSANWSKMRIEVLETISCQ